MADVTVMEGQTNGFTPAPEPRKRGRPSNASREAAKQTEISAQPEDVEPLPDDNGDFWLHILNLTPDEWNLRLAYLIRLAPTIEKRSGGKPASIATYACPFDRDKIMKEHGSGVYRIDFLIQNQHTGKYTRYRQVRFDIMNMDYPPNVPYGEWIERPENESWKWAGPKLLAREAAEAAATGSPMPRTNGGVPLYPPGMDFNKILEQNEKGLKMGLEMAKAMTPPQAPAKDDSVLVTLLTKLIDISLNRPDPPKPDDTATKSLIEFLNKQNDRLAEEMKELRKNAATAPAANNPLTQLKEWKPLISEFVEVFAQKTGNQPWWAGPLEKLMDGVGEAIPTVVKMVEHNQRQHTSQPQPMRPPFSNTVQNGLQPPPAAPPPANAAPIDVQPQQQPEPAVELTPEQQEQQRTEAIARKWTGFIIHVLPQMIEHFRAIGDSNGLDFRDWVLRKKGEDPWGDMRREIGPAMLASMICELVANNPQDQNLQQLQPPGAVAQFCEEFFTIPEQEDEDDDEGGEPIAAA